MLCTHVIAGSQHGWRFQGTDDSDVSLIIDVFKSEDGWHVHKSYDYAGLTDLVRSMLARLSQD